MIIVMLIRYRIGGDSENRGFLRHFVHRYFGTFFIMLKLDVLSLMKVIFQPQRLLTLQTLLPRVCVPLFVLFFFGCFVFFLRKAIKTS